MSISSVVFIFIAIRPNNNIHHILGGESHHVSSFVVYTISCFLTYSLFPAAHECCLKSALVVLEMVEMIISSSMQSTCVSKLFVTVSNSWIDVPRGSGHVQLN